MHQEVLRKLPEKTGRANAGVEQTFRRIDANRFSAAAYRGGDKVCQGSASIAGGMMGHGSIEYSMTDEPRQHERSGFCQGAAELFWELFIRPLQS